MVVPLVLNSGSLALMHFFKNLFNLIKTKYSKSHNPKNSNFHNFNHSYLYKPRYIPITNPLEGYSEVIIPVF